MLTNDSELIKFIDTTKVFVRNINTSLIERDQLIDSLEILLDIVMDYQSSGKGVDKSYGRIISLLETLIKSASNRQAIDEDLVMVYEMRRLKSFKNKLLEEGISEECPNSKTIQKQNAITG
ncbi:hypothetical protein [uncultured Enterococcus sp.]|uniref:hypothetical protein n=1 Tax=uncultured Enterococcus sp. TaxID=167972 RepID=UPI002AA88157|nr:hypothetical protein [uncultured Enterococcus sp.]